MTFHVPDSKPKHNAARHRVQPTGFPSLRSACQRLTPAVELEVCYMKVIMNTRSNSSLVILIALALVLAIACNSITPFLKPPPTAIPKIVHFENDFVAFDYPEGMKVFNAANPAFTPYPENQLGGQLVASLADPAEFGNYGHMYRTVGFFRHSIPSGSNLEQVMEAAYQPVDRREGAVDANGPVTLAGLPAYQQTYRIYGGETYYELRDIWAEKDGMIFRVSIWTVYHNPQVFAAFQSLADKILDSLVIKENLPPLVETPTSEPTLTPTPFPAAMLRHFENDVVAFDYLEGLNVYEAGNATFQCYPDFQLGGELVVGLGDPKFIKSNRHLRSIRIFSEKMPPGSNLEFVMYKAYLLPQVKFPHEKGVVDATGLVTVAGLSAFQWTYRISSGESAYELRDVWVPKDGELFIISIWTEYTNPDDFAVFQAGADLLLKSLHLK